MLVTSIFAEQAQAGIEATLELEEMFTMLQPKELFATEDEDDWNGWCEFFLRTRETDGRRQGIVEPER